MTGSGDNNINSSNTKRPFKENAEFIAMLFIMAIGIGAVMGFLGTAFNLLIEKGTDLFARHIYIIWLLPLGGLLIAFIYKKWDGGNTNNVINSIRTGEDTPKLMALWSFISTVITRTLGGSVGTEGAAIQVGGGVADLFGIAFKRPASHKRMLMMCGLSAGFT